MVETYVRLLCPECSKQWEAAPGSLPAPNRSFDCPNCQNTRRLAEFTRTTRDLETLKSLR